MMSRALLCLAAFAALSACRVTAQAPDPFCPDGQMFAVGESVVAYSGFGENVIHSATQLSPIRGTITQRLTVVPNTGMWDPNVNTFQVQLMVTDKDGAAIGTGLLESIASPLTTGLGSETDGLALNQDSDSTDGGQATFQGWLRYQLFDLTGAMEMETEFYFQGQVFDCCAAPNSWWNDRTPAGATEESRGLGFAAWAANGWDGQDYTADTTMGIDLAWSLRCTSDPLGGIGSDPHVEGFLGQHFNVLGENHHVYNMVTSPHLQYNARFNATKFYHKNKPGTYISEMGLLVGGSQRVRVFVAGSGAETVQVELNGEPVDVRNFVALSEDKTEWLMRTGETTVTIVTRDFHFNVKGEKMGLRAHLDDGVRLVNWQAAGFIHGLLGQTAGPNRKQKESHKREYVVDFEWPEFLDGRLSDYDVSSGDIFGSGFTYNLYDGSM